MLMGIFEVQQEAQITFITMEVVQTETLAAVTYIAFRTVIDFFAWGIVMEIATRAEISCYSLAVTKVALASSTDGLNRSTKHAIHCLNIVSVYLVVLAFVVAMATNEESFATFGIHLVVSSIVSTSKHLFSIL